MLSLQSASLLGSLVDLGSTGHDRAVYQAVKAAGHSGVILDLQTGGWTADAAAATQAGLGFAVFQGYYAPDWADPAKAQARARYAVDQAAEVGYPKGAHVFLDWEQVALSIPAALSWINTWAAVVVQAGYAAGLYVGVPQPLSGEDLYGLIPNVHLYWRSLSASTVDVAARGYAIRQSAGPTIAGVAFDADHSGHDALGGHLIGAIAPPPTDPLQAAVTTLTQENEALHTQVDALTMTTTQLRAKIAAAQAALN